jgi:UDP-N-acetylmuramyl pentapeptide phosphotransferase/UDP-N-acetylglucosamine-1-phosphate transferase
MTYLLVALAVAFLVTLGLLRIHIMRRVGSAGDVDGGSRRARRMRALELSGLGRTGGLGVVAGLAVSFFARSHDASQYAASSAGIGLVLLGCAMPVFVAGLIEDLTHRVSKEVRLVAALVSAMLAGWLLGAWVVRLDVALLQSVIATPLAMAALTCLLVAGITNAFNIIDGFNGLASGVAALILLGIAYVAFKVGDVSVMTAALTAVGATAGFMLLNFPRGLVYLGDGGAYLLGFWIGVLLLLLVGRNPEVSPWFAVLICSYPVCELLFSIYRRGVVRRAHPGLPDLAHLHHLIYKRLVRWVVGTDLPAHRTQRNSLTAPYLWILTSIGVAPAVMFWRDTHILQFGSLLFAAAYLFAYARIVKFRAPRWWVLRKPHRKPPAGRP